MTKVQDAPERATLYQEETPLSRIVAATPQRDLLSIPEQDREALWRYAQLAVKGGFSGRHKSAESAYCAILYGIEIGLSINQALQNVYVVNGRAACETEAKAALVVMHGHPPPEAWIVNEDIPEKAVAFCLCIRDGKETERSFSMAEAKAAGLTGKDVWKGYWRDMLQWRAMDRAIDRVFPDIVKGLASAEVMRDVGRDALRHDLQEVDTAELVEALRTEAPEEEKPKRRRGRPRKEEPSEERREELKTWEAPDDSAANTEVEAKASAADHLPGDDFRLSDPLPGTPEERERAIGPEPDPEPPLEQRVDPAWLWEGWRRASENLAPNQIRQIKDRVTKEGQCVFCARMPSEMIERAIQLAKEVGG